MIDITQFSEQQLIDLNKKIVTQLKFLQQNRTQKSMLQFNIGEAVTFDYEGEIRFGILTKFNQKSVTVITDDQTKWTIHPSFLKKVKREEKDVTPQKKVITVKASTSSSKPVSRNSPCPCGSGKKYKRCCV